MTEEWREAPGFPDYAVSSLGRVRRVKPDRQGKYCGHLLKPFTNRDGHVVATLTGSDGLRRRGVHQLVCEAFHGPMPTPGLVVAHWDGNAGNNTPGNLRWATRSDNERDKTRHGIRPALVTRPELRPRGGQHPNSKLSEDAVRAIRIDQRSNRDLAAEYGVSATLISGIRRGKGWRHVG